MVPEPYPTDPTLGARVLADAQVQLQPNQQKRAPAARSETFASLSVRYSAGGWKLGWAALYAATNAAVPASAGRRRSVSTMPEASMVNDSSCEPSGRGRVV